MTDAPPRAEECAGLVYPVSERYGLIIAGLLIALPALAVPDGAATVTISPGSSIATAITSAGSGGTVILNPGTYYQNGITVGNAVTIRADTENGHGPWDTIIDGSRSGTSILTATSTSLAIDNLTPRNAIPLLTGRRGMVA